MKTLGRRSLVLIVLAILLVALPGCQGKTLEPSNEATPEEIIRTLAPSRLTGVRGMLCIRTISSGWTPRQ